MKKLLCGLVIALMMTGSGYSREISEKEKCDYLLKNINLNIETAILVDDAEEREFEKVKDAFLDDGKKVDMTVANELGNDELKMIKDAHYFAVLWQTICKD
jgi:hypothetical protein